MPYLTDRLDGREYGFPCPGLGTLREGAAISNTALASESQHRGRRGGDCARQALGYRDRLFLIANVPNTSRLFATKHETDQRREVPGAHCRLMDRDFQARLSSITRVRAIFQEKDQTQKKNNNPKTNGTRRCLAGRCPRCACPSGDDRTRQPQAPLRTTTSRAGTNGKKTQRQVEQVLSQAHAPRAGARCSPSHASFPAVRLAPGAGPPEAALTWPEEIKREQRDKPLVDAWGQARWRV